MKLKYLGTAAAEGIPAMFCMCEDCKKAHAIGGRNRRTRSQAIINDSVILDFGPDTYCHAGINGIDLTHVHHYLITHCHRDHLLPSELRFMDRGDYAVLPDDFPPYHVYGSPETIEKATPSTEISLLSLHTVEPFVPFEVNGLTVTALKAWHDTAQPYFYWITDGEKHLLYAHDTDIFPEETWEYLAAQKPRFDLVSMDCTGAAHEDLPYHGHMCLGRNIQCRDRMREMGLLKEHATMVLNHFSHNGKVSCYDDFVKIAEPYGFAVSYDGMEIVL